MLRHPLSSAATEYAICSVEISPTNIAVDTASSSTLYLALHEAADHVTIQPSLWCRHCTEVDSKSVFSQQAYQKRLSQELFSGLWWLQLCSCLDGERDRLVTAARSVQGTLLPAPPTRGLVRSANIRHLLPYVLDFVFHIALACCESLCPDRYREPCLLQPLHT